MHVHVCVHVCVCVCMCMCVHAYTSSYIIIASYKDRVIYVEISGT